MMREEDDGMYTFVRRGGRWLVLAIAALGAALGTACRGDKAIAPALQPADQTIGPIVVSPTNAIMAVGDTLSLVVSGRTLSGTPIAAFDSVRYVLDHVTDTVRVRVSSTGIVTAFDISSPYSPVWVNVFAFKNGLVSAEQVNVQVTATRLAHPTLSIQPVPPDSARLAWGSTKTIVPVIQSATTGDMVDGPVFRYEYSSADSTKMGCYIPSYSTTSGIDRGQLQQTPCGTNYNLGGPGLNMIQAFAAGAQVWVHARANVYGQFLHDSVQYTLTNVFQGIVEVYTNNFAVGGGSGTPILVAPGAVVYFFNFMSRDLGGTVTFALDHPEAATSDDPPSPTGGAMGDITALQGGEYATRKFLTPGTYQWTATVHGASPPFTGATTSGVIKVE